MWFPVLGMLHSASRITVPLLNSPRGLVCGQSIADSPIARLLCANRRFAENAGKPRLLVDGRLERAFAEQRIVSAHVSLSHDGEYAVAHVILER
jgi:hypothetical protein